MSAELLLLKLRSAIASKEFFVSCANRDNDRGGWSADWSEAVRVTDEEITSLISEIEVKTA